MQAIIGVLFLLIAAVASGAPQKPIPRDYLIGPISTDAGNALRRAKEQRRPVWIIAWDDKFKEPAGQNIAHYHLGYFYQNPETRKLVSENFVQIFTTLSNSSILQWVDLSDRTHVPIYIVLDRNGELVLRKHHYANPQVALKDVEAVVAKIK